jgi:predicted permease
MSNVFKMVRRGLRRAPGVSLAAIACAALGVAATSAVATVVFATVLRPMPFPESHRLVRVWLARDDGTDARVSLSIPEVRELEGSIPAFDALLATARSRTVAMFDGGARRIRGEAVTRDYFSTLGVQAQLGRLLQDDDYRPAAERVIVLSEATWRQQFGSDPAVIGRSLRTDAGPVTVTGVVAGTFQGTVEEDVVEFWSPLPQYQPVRLVTERAERESWVLGRLRPGVTAAVAEQQIRSHFQEVARQYPEVYRGLGARVEPFGENWRGRLRTGGWILLSAAVLLLLVGALNVAGLLASRALARQSETAVAIALGAHRWHVTAHAALEALLLVGIGGAIGVALSPAVLTAFLQLSPVALPTYIVLAPDAGTVLVAFGSIVLVSMIAAAIPASLATRTAPAEALRTGGRSSVSGRKERQWGGVLVAAETAFTLVVLVAGSLLLLSYSKLHAVPLGYQVEGIARLAVTANRLDVADAPAFPAFFERLRSELRSVPGADSVALVSPTLPPWDPDRTRVHAASLGGDTQNRGLPTGVHMIDASFLSLLRIPLVAGRNVTDSDRGGLRTPALISRSLAERLGGVEAVMGREATLDDDGVNPAVTIAVVGVVENVAYDGLGEQGTGRLIRYGDPTDARGTDIDVYLPLSAVPSRQISIGARTSGDPAALIEPLRRAIARVAPNSAVHWTGTMRDELALEYAAPRFFAVLVSTFSTATLALSGMGIFAVLSHLVTRRSREIGLRRALGSSERQILTYVIQLALVPLGLGIAVGLGLALLLSSVVSGMLYGVTALDIRAFASSALLIASAAAAGTIVPARRASHVDPMVTLRGE